MNILLCVINIIHNNQLIPIKILRENIRLLNSDQRFQNLKEFEIIDRLGSPGEHPERYP
jgi:hypothetical protein